MAVTTALLADPVYREHLIGRDHPERPERFDAVLHGLEKTGVVARALRLESRAATDDELLLCHTREYLKTAQHDVAAGYPSLTTGDTDITPKSWDVAVRAVGGR